MEMSGKGTTRLKSRNWILWLFYLAFSLLLYSPVWNKSFAADDFSVIYRILYENNFIEQGFFRPLSDLSIYLCYLIGGTSPVAYNLFSIVLHSLNAFILYRIADLLLDYKQRNWLLPEIAGILFILYPFHNESVVWVVGHGSLLSSFFGFTALWVALAGNGIWRIGLSALLYFLAMSTYESVTPLPVMIMLLLYLRGRSMRAIIPWLLVFSLALLTNLAIRRFLSEDIVGDYGSRIFDHSITDNLTKFAKVFGRFWLPPMASVRIMTLITACIGLFITVVCFFVYHKREMERHRFFILSAVLLFSCLIAFLFGVSTRTIEGDRLLYFPSFFFCLWLSYSLGLLLDGPAFHIVTACVAVYFGWFLMANNFTWKTAGRLTQQVIADMRSLTDMPRPVYLLNMPEEYNGALVFRNGFYAALLLDGIDTAGIRLLSFQGQSSAINTRVTLFPVQVPPACIDIAGKNMICGNQISYIDKNGDSLLVPISPQGMIAYWNNHRFVPLVMDRVE